MRNIWVKFGHGLKVPPGQYEREREGSMVTIVEIKFITSIEFCKVQPSLEKHAIGQ